MAGTVVVAGGLFAWQRSGATDPAELTRAAEQRENIGASGLGSQTDKDVRARVASYVVLCRAAVRKDVWPGRVVAFDGGVEPSAIVPYVTPRSDGLPIMRVEPRTQSDTVEPIQTPSGGRFGVSGNVVYTAWFSDSQANRRYFCEIDAASGPIEVTGVSIEIVR